MFLLCSIYEKLTKVWRQIALMYFCIDRHEVIGTNWSTFQKCGPKLCIVNENVHCYRGVGRLSRRGCSRALIERLQARFPLNQPVSTCSWARNQTPHCPRWFGQHPAWHWECECVWMNGTNDWKEKQLGH